MLPTQGVLRALVKLDVPTPRKPAVGLDSAQALGAQLRRLEDLRAALSPAAWQALARAGLGAELQAVRAQLNQLNTTMRRNAAQAVSLMEAATGTSDRQATASQLSNLQTDIGQAFSALKLAGYYAGDRHPVEQRIRTWKASASNFQAEPPAPATQAATNGAAAAPPTAASPTPDPDNGEPCRPLMAYPIPQGLDKAGKPDQFEPSSMRFGVAPALVGKGPVCPLDPRQALRDIVKSIPQAAAFTGKVLRTAGTPVAIANGVGALGGAMFELGLREERTGPKITADNAVDEYLKLRANPDDYIAKNYVNGFAGIRAGDRFYNFSGHLLEMQDPEDGTPYFFRRVPEDIYKALKEAQRARGNQSNEVFFPEVVLDKDGKASIQLVEIRPPFRAEPFRDAYFRVARGEKSSPGSFLVTFEAGFGKPEGQRAEVNALAGFNYQFSSSLAKTFRLQLLSPTERDYSFGYRQQVTNYWTTFRLGAGTMVFNGAQAIDRTDPAAPFSGEFRQVAFPRAYFDLGDRFRAEAVAGGSTGRSAFDLSSAGGVFRVRRTGVVELGAAVDGYKWDNLNGANGNFNAYLEAQLYLFDNRIQWGRMRPLGRGSSAVPTRIGPSYTPLTPFNIDPSFQFTTLDKRWTAFHGLSWSAPPLVTDRPARVVGLDLSTSRVSQLSFPEARQGSSPSAAEITGHSEKKTMTLADGQIAVVARVRNRSYLTVQGRVFEVPNINSRLAACLRYTSLPGGQPATLECVTSFKLPQLPSNSGPRADDVAWERGKRFEVPAGIVYLAKVGSGNFAVLHPRDGRAPQRFDITLWPEPMVRDYFKLMPARPDSPRAGPAQPTASPSVRSDPGAGSPLPRDAGQAAPTNPPPPAPPRPRQRPVTVPPGAPPTGSSSPLPEAPVVPAPAATPVQPGADARTRSESPGLAPLNSSMRQDAAHALDVMDRIDPLLRQPDLLTETDLGILAAGAADLQALRPRIARAFEQLKQGGYYVGDEHPVVRQLDRWLARINETLSLPAPAPAPAPAPVPVEPAAPQPPAGIQPQPAPAELQPPASAPAQVDQPPELRQPSAPPEARANHPEGLPAAPMPAEQPLTTPPTDMVPLAPGDGPDLSIIINSALQADRQYSVSRGTVLVAELDGETYAVFLPNDGTPLRFRLTGLDENEFLRRFE
jgi:hypothetical protein